MPVSTSITITALFQRSTLDDPEKAASSGCRNLRKFRNSAPAVPEKTGADTQLAYSSIRKFRNMRALVDGVCECRGQDSLICTVYQRLLYFRKLRQPEERISGNSGYISGGNFYSSELAVLWSSDGCLRFAHLVYASDIPPACRRRRCPDRRDSKASAISGNSGHRRRNFRSFRNLTLTLVYNPDVLGVPSVSYMREIYKTDGKAFDVRQGSR